MEDLSDATRVAVPRDYLKIYSNLRADPYRFGCAIQDSYLVVLEKEALQKHPSRVEYISQRCANRKGDSITTRTER